MVFGWDVSTAIIGVCALTDDGAPVKFSYIDIRDEKTMVGKYRKAYGAIVKILSSGSKDDRHFIEDRLGGFTRGFTNQNTLLKLAAMNAVVTFIISTAVGDRNVVHITPVSAKAAVGLKVRKGGDKKLAAIRFAMAVDDFPAEMKKGGRNYKDHVADMADAYIIALAGYRKYRAPST